MIKSVLVEIHVYWIALTWIPKRILNSVRKLCSHFLWAGAKENGALPWVAWEKIALPKAWGGWGINDLPVFTSSLATKSGWCVLSMENLLTLVVKRKYIYPLSIEG